MSEDRSEGIFPKNPLPQPLTGREGKSVLLGDSTPDGSKSRIASLNRYFVCDPRILIAVEDAG